MPLRAAPWSFVLSVLMLIARTSSTDVDRSAGTCSKCDRPAGTSALAPAVRAASCRRSFHGDVNDLSAAQATKPGSNWSQVKPRGLAQEPEIFVLEYTNAVQPVLRSPISL